MWTIRFTYDPKHDYVHAEFNDVLLQDDADVERWRREVSARLGTFGRKVELIINLTGLVVRPKAGPSFGKQRSEVLKRFTTRSFRYGGDGDTKTSIFTSSVLHGADANVYRSRELAVEGLLKWRAESAAR